MRAQVTRQALKNAMGYRLVLPSCVAGDAPKLLPARSRRRDVAWYSLEPFAYPDDIRLSAGRWYRIVWVDSLGQRIRMQPGEPVPGLYYFVGPAQLHTPPPTACDPNLNKPQAQPESASQSADSPAAGTSATQTAPAVELAAAPPRTIPQSSATELNDDEVDALARELVRAMKSDKELGAGNTRSKKQTKEADGFVVVLPPPPISPPPESWTHLLASFPPITADENLLLIEFVTHPELIMQIRYEEQLADAKTSGRSAPREPTTLLGHEQRQHLHALFTGRMVRSHFWSLCKAIFEYARQHGVEALAYLSVPIPPLPETEQHWIETAIKSLPKRTYMHYVCARQDALLGDQPMPVEPSVPLSTKERSRIRKIMQDLRAVMFFKRCVSSAAS